MAKSRPEKCNYVQEKDRRNAQALEGQHYHIFHALKVGDYNVGRNDALLTIPFYMLFLVREV